MTIKEFEIQLALGTLSYEDKMKLANNSRTSKKILAILSSDRYWNIKCSVASNPNTPIKVLTTLSEDEDWYVKYLANDNSN